jgi:hypothetical protein
VAVIYDFFAHLLGNVLDIVVVLANTIEQIESIILAQVPMELWSRTKADEDLENRHDYLPLSLVSLGIPQLL